jgi:UDP-N-acetylmuramoyl-L-alanyl-D-glutamate--2,6-diaminopimelate ligase
MEEFIKKLLESYNIQNLSTDSRNIIANTAFFDLSASKNDSTIYIEDAIKNGSRLIFTEKKTTILSEIIIYVKNIKEVLIIASSIIYKNEPKYKVAATGTNGKSSVAFYFAQICHEIGVSSASLGTLGIFSSVSNSNLKQDLTTEDFITTKNNLNILANNKVNYVCLEASSHGLKQGRLGNLKFNSASFVSFSQDHLDYHGSLEDYLNSKLILFKNNLIPNAQVVINKQISCYDKIVRYLKSECDVNIINVGYFDIETDINDCKILHIESRIDSSIFSFLYRGKTYISKINIVGSFQVMNVLIASIMAESCGLSFEDIVNILPKLKAPTGRLDRIENRNIFIDYAHSPESLEFTINELNKLKPHKDSKLITVFGCGGDRDKTKRKIMGSIASNLSDIVIITDDNPRFENPDLIRADILSGIDYRKNIFEIPERKNAIYKAIEMMKENDILLIAGKGHEKFQLVEGQKIIFDEFEIIKNYLKK